MTRNQLISAFFIVLLIFIISQVLYILSPFVGPIFWAAVLAFGFYPLHEKIKTWLKPNLDTLPALITTVTILLLILPLVIFFIFSLASESANFYHWIMQMIQERKFDSIIESMKNHPVAGRIYRTLMRYEFIRDHSEVWTADFLKNLGHIAAAKGKVLLNSLIFAPLNIILTFFLLFFFMRDGHRIVQFIRSAAPLEEDVKEVLFKQLQDTFSAVIRGQFVTAIAQGLLAALIYWTLGVPLPIFFAGLTFITSLIPVLGAALVWVPLVAYLALSGLYTKAVWLFILGTFGISLVDNVLKPILIGEKTKLPYLVLFLGILGGMQVYGLFGIFLAPTVLSLFFVLVKIYKEKMLKN